jgi:hypothetical protein
MPVVKRASKLPQITQVRQLQVSIDVTIPGISPSVSSSRAFAHFIPSLASIAQKFGVKNFHTRPDAIGLDLKDDLSRFQIITKVPYPNKGDIWTDKKRKIDEDWYWQTALKLIQGYGKSIRSKEDWARTYVLDSAFGYFVKNKIILPDCFTQAIQAR